jgi:hypothetical protein
VTGGSQAGESPPRAQHEGRQVAADDLLPIDHVRLVQRRLDIDAQLGQLEQGARLRAREAFVEVAASWCTRNEITAEALREVGVPARVLARAGL